jgi:hypothetical protein
MVLRRTFCEHPQRKPALGGTFHNIKELRKSLLELKRISYENWIIQRHGYKTPAQYRREQSQGLLLAADLAFIFAQKPVDLH